jgi:filamentous hemagglutinin
VAGVLGQNAAGAVTAAVNEALNNATKHLGVVLDTSSMTPEEREQYFDTQVNVLAPTPDSGTTETKSGGEVVNGPAPPVGGGSSATGTSGQTPFQRGIQFQGDALSALGVPENTQRITVTLPNGTPVTVIPDAMDGSTIIEVKDVANLSNSNQFRGYAATGNSIQLIVSPGTSV